MQVYERLRDLVMIRRPKGMTSSVPESKIRSGTRLKKSEHFLIDFSE
jgi:hypothetical protein